jgi:site-specific recombinase XerD
MRLFDAVNLFTESCEADDLAKSTIDWYKSSLKCFVEWLGGETPLADVTPSHIRKYFVSLKDGKYESDTIWSYKRALHRFWKWVGDEWGMVNPMRNIKYPSPPKRTIPKAVSVDDASLMFNVIPDNYEGYRNKAILCVLIDTTARAGEICSMRMEHLDMKNRTVFVIGKTGLRRLSFTSYTANIIQKWLDVRSPMCEWVFYNIRNLEPLTSSGIYQMCKKIKAQAGVKGRANPHSFRHAFAREYLLAGGDLATLSKIMGHSSVETTASHYAIFVEKELDEKHATYSPIHHLTRNPKKD